MSNDLLAQWAAKDVKQRIQEHFDRIGMTLEFESLDWEETQRIAKESTIRKKNGSVDFDQDEYLNGMVADSLKAIVKKDENGEEISRQEINLRSRETLESLGVKDVKGAINRLFAPKEMERVMNIVRKFDGTSEDESKEIEELKNA